MTKRTMIRTACITRWRRGYGSSQMHRRAKALRVKGDDAFRNSYDEDTPLLAMKTRGIPQQPGRRLMAP